MKHVSKILMVLAMFGMFASMSYAETAKDPKIEQFTKEITDLERQLAVKKNEYNKYMNSLPEVKTRGRASKCSYRCNLHHRRDYYMWSQCFNACTSR